MTKVKPLYSHTITCLPHALVISSTFIFLDISIPCNQHPHPQYRADCKACKKGQFLNLGVPNLHYIDPITDIPYFCNLTYVEESLQANTNRHKIWLLSFAASQATHASLIIIDNKWTSNWIKNERKVKRKVSSDSSFSLSLKVVERKGGGCS